MLVWVACGYLLFFHEKTYTKAQIDKMFAPITSRYGLRIVYEIGEDFFSPIVNPPIPAGPGRNSKVTQIKQSVLVNYPRLLQETFAKYPDQVIKAHINAIYFSAEINEDGLKYGGTYDPFRRILYIVDNGSRKDDHSIYSIHHEISSLLLVRHSFFINPWTDHNPKNFNYLFDVFKESAKIYSQTSLVGSKEDYLKGFMDSYGQTSFENDFNEYSAMIFTYPEKFKNIMNRYPRVRAKFLVWLNYYHKIDPIFTEEYFLGQSRK